MFGRVPLRSNYPDQNIYLCAESDKIRGFQLIAAEHRQSCLFANYACSENES